MKQMLYTTIVMSNCSAVKRFLNDEALKEYAQYAESRWLWLPDSRFLLYCSMQPESFDIMVAYAEESIAPRKIADGLMTTWSPR